MKLGIIITTNDPESCWNALRFANYATGQKDNVKVFLWAKALSSRK